MASREDRDIQEYVQRKKWKWKEEGHQFRIKVCPFCGDADQDGSGHFYLNAITGQYYCHKCPAQGTSLYFLKKSLGDISGVSPIDGSRSSVPTEEYDKLRRRILGYHNVLKGNSRVLKLLKEKWGFDLDAVKEFHLGVRKSKNVYWLVIPLIKGGKIVNAKFRSLPPADKTFRRIANMESSLFNIDNVDPKLKYLFMIEGESDAINAHMMGLHNVVGVTVGARGFKPEWKDFVDRFEVLYTVYDSDEAGQEGAKKLAFRVGLHKCRNIVIPRETFNPTEDPDLTGFLKSGHKLVDFKKLVKSAVMFDIEDVKPLKSVLEELEDSLFLRKRVEFQGLLTPWPNVNKLVGPFMPGDLIVVSGRAKVGKTTFALNVLADHSFMGVPTLLYCLEMRPERLGVKVVSYYRYADSTKLTREDVVVVRSLYGSKPLYIAHTYDVSNVDQVYDTIRESVKRYGIELLVFDHLHFLIRSLEQTSSEVSVACRSFKLLAEELRVPIILIVQPRKIQGRRARMTIDDLRDSSAIGQDCDTLIIIHRDRLPRDPKKKSGTQIFSPTAEIIVEATRYNPGGYTELYYNGALNRYFISLKDERRILNEKRRTGIK